MRPSFWRSSLLVSVLACVGVTPAVLLANETGDVLGPYQGPSPAGVDTRTLVGKIMCGYQGWFACPGDGSGLGWVHWGRGMAQPQAGGRAVASGRVTVDLWPDMAEYAADERFTTRFQHADGRPAEVFSSHKRATVLRHFRWMSEYGIDGAFVQRFTSGLTNSVTRHHRDTALAHCRQGANREGRAYAVMYDLSGSDSKTVQGVEDDWRTLRSKMRIGEDPAYLHHAGKPLVAVWGVGFNDGRRYTLEDCRRLIEFLKADGCSVMLGVPTGWRTLDRDAIPDAALHEVLRQADLLSPWTIGRYRNQEEVQRHALKCWQPDRVWCGEAGLDYLPVVFPGFSWHNLKGGPLGQIPRDRGRFLWSQFVAAKRSGAEMIYVAMFDEVDEATAIFKCTNDVPMDPANRFLTYEGLPSDFYLRLTGLGGRFLRGELSTDTAFPTAELRRTGEPD